MRVFESNSSNNAFVELYAVPGRITCGESFSARLDGDMVSSISFLEHSGDIPLFIRRDPSAQTVSVFAKRASQWVELGAQSLPKAASTLCVTLEENNRILITVAGGGVIRLSFDLNLDLVYRICGSGGVLSFDVGAGDDLGTLLSDIAEHPSELTYCPNLIYDVGVHIGNDTDYYLKKGFSVVGIEANRKLAEVVARRFKSYIESGALRILNVGIGPEAGFSTFYISTVNSEQSSFSRDLAERLGAVIEEEVRIVRPLDIFKACGVPYYLKIDIEGCDLIVLDDVLLLPIKPKFLSFENAPLGWADYIEKLNNAGYKKFALMKQKDIPGSRAPMPSLEGRGVEHTFLEATSGPFGRDIDADNWHSAEGFFEELKRLRESDSSLWIDIHAALEP